jgi:hypothetical protein
LITVLDEVVLVAASCVLPRAKRAAARVRGEVVAERDALAALDSDATRSTRRKAEAWGKEFLRLGIEVVEHVQEEKDAAPAIAACAVVG